MRPANTQEIQALPYAKPFLDGTLKLFYTPLRDEYMGIAWLEAKHNSTDKNHPTGAVIVVNGEIISQLPNKAGYTNRIMIWLHQNVFCMRRFLRVKSGTRYDLCRGCATTENHAESRASTRVLELHPEGLTDATLFLWGHYWCCEGCCNRMIQAGIKNVVLRDDARRHFGR
jgi:deoxycytidylate deaminase